MNATATKTAAKPADDKIEDTKSNAPPKTAAELQQEEAGIYQSLKDLKDLSKMGELMASLKAVKEQIADIEKERTVSLKDVSEAILIHSIKFSELTEAARQMLGAVVANRAVAASDGTKKRGVPKGTPRNIQKTGAVLIEIESLSGRGAGPTYNKGQELAATVGPSWKAMYEANKDNFAVALAAKFSEEGKTYFATEEGKAELAKFIEWVKAKPAAKPAKK